MKTLLLGLLVLVGINNNTTAQNCLNFDGPSDLVQTNYTGVLGSANRTFEAWVYVSSSAPNSNLAILDYGLNAVGSRNTFAVSSSRALSFTSGGTNANIATPASSVPLDQWAHVAFVLNNSIGYLYVNGVQLGTGSLSTVNTPSGNESIKIGQRVAGGSIPFFGSIDEIRVWDDARTQTEIQTNMNNELCSVDANLQLYLRLNEGVANGVNTAITTAEDFSGNSHSSTLNSFALTGSTSNWVTGVALTPGYSLSNSPHSACNSYTWPVNSTTYTNSGSYFSVLSGANINGCDSLITLDLTINTTNDFTSNVSSCDSYTWVVNGQTYTTSSVVVEPLTTAQGCPYNHTLNLTLGQSNSGSIDITSCDSYTWAETGQTYTSSGTHTTTLTNISGCDSILTLNLTINAVDNSITNNGDLSITATEGNGIYQWLDCDNNYAIIAGETSQSFTASVNGNYAVEVNANGCVDTSACELINIVNIDELNSSNSIVVFPNPIKSQVSLNFGAEISVGDITVLDAFGRKLKSINFKSRSEISFSLNETAGIYFIHVKDENNNLTILKVVKE